jgi:hypothetical protein
VSVGYDSGVFGGDEMGWAGFIILPGKRQLESEDVIRLMGKFLDNIVVVSGTESS